jgi:hypothetical protein
MPLSWDRITELVLASLPTSERKASIVYLDEQVHPAGSQIRVGGREIKRDWPAVMAFVDLEPEFNWAHACRYLLVHAETGAIESIDARMPPYLRELPPTFKVIWRSESAPFWAVLGA